MDEFRLKVFISAAQHLSFTRCAKEMYISQPAVSKHIAELEKGYGLPLFERVGTKLALTPAGKLLLQHAIQLVGGYNALNYEMGLLSNNLQGALTIAASSTIMQYIMPPVIAKFTNRFDDVKLPIMSCKMAAI